jgi:solute carrier family 10 (sodium/bile acid cotransporter), member 7
VVLVASQKTLPVAVTVLNQLAPSVAGVVGLAVVPVVASHLLQILADSLLVSHWLAIDRAQNQRNK